MNTLLRWVELLARGLVVAFTVTVRGATPAELKVAAFSFILPLALLFSYTIHALLQLGVPQPTGQGHSGLLAVVLMAALLLVGWALFWLRENRRFTYGCLELSAAMATVYNAALHTYGSQERLSLLLAYLGALYIAVRAYDNLSKAFKDFEAQQKRG